MCSPLVADPYFSAQAAITHSPSKLALQIGVLRQRRANCDAVSVPRLHHIDQVYRIGLEGAGYHTTDSSAHIAARRRRAACSSLVPAAIRHPPERRGGRSPSSLHRRPQHRPGAALRDPEEGKSLQSIAVHDALKITHERFGLALAPQSRYF
jgi:hypothetical protein